MPPTPLLFLSASVSAATGLDPAAGLDPELRLPPLAELERLGLALALGHALGGLAQHHLTVRRQRHVRADAPVRAVGAAAGLGRAVRLRTKAAAPTQGGVSKTSDSFASKGLRRMPR